MQWEIRIGKIARDLAKSSNLNDSHGTMPFTEFMDQLEEELRGNLATNYVSEPNWRERWRQIIRGSQVTSFKLVWLHAQYIQCEEHTPFTEDWWAAVPTPIRIKFIGSTSAPITLRLAVIHCLLTSRRRFFIIHHCETFEVSRDGALNAALTAAKALSLAFTWLLLNTMVPNINCVRKNFWITT